MYRRFQMIHHEEQRRELQGVCVAVDHEAGERVSAGAHVLQQARPAGLRQQEGARGVPRPVRLLRPHGLHHRLKNEKKIKPARRCGKKRLHAAILVACAVYLLVHYCQYPCVASRGYYTIIELLNTRLLELGFLLSLTEERVQRTRCTILYHEMLRYFWCSPLNSYPYVYYCCSPVCGLRVRFEIDFFFLFFFRG